jgi:transposase
MRAAEQDRPDVKAARKRWRKEQPAWDARRLVFIDETGLNTLMARHYGRCPVGRRYLSTLPHGHWQTLTFIAALRHDRIAAPFLVEGPMDAAAFTVYLEHVLCPELRPGDTLILDNLSTHKIPSVPRLLAASGAQVRYLPAYSPDLNPMEQAIAKLKAHLRQVAARTVNGLINAVPGALEAFSASHCRAFFRHALYASM